MSEGDSLSSVLERRAGRARGSVRFLGLREDEEPIAFSRFAEEAGRVGAGLRARGLKPGALLGLMVRSDMNFARVFLGAVAAGVVPVPLYPPASLKRIDHYLDNLRGVLAVLGLDAVVVAPEVRPVLELVKREGLRGVRVLDLDEVTRATEDPIFHRAAPDELAFIQCTSGSTSVPKPVMIRHENVLANLDALGQQGGDGEGDAMCLWLPMYHDMG
ncbi:MAG: AMP-binding protein, partial [Myxococcales bacterium]|nr:AMP-binding protein [Myxococcales bacterium]